MHHKLVPTRGVDPRTGESAQSNVLCRRQLLELLREKALSDIDRARKGQMLEMKPRMSCSSRITDRQVSDILGLQEQVADPSLSHAGRPDSDGISGPLIPLLDLDPQRERDGMEGLHWNNIRTGAGPKVRPLDTRSSLVRETIADHSLLPLHSPSPGPVHGRPRPC